MNVYIPYGDVIGFIIYAMGFIITYIWLILNEIKYTEHNEQIDRDFIMVLSFIWPVLLMILFMEIIKKIFKHKST